MKYQIADVYTKKEYECKKCGGKIYYAKLADETGKLITTDGLEPNGRYGKDSNVLSGAVDALVKDRLHGCSAHFVDEAISKLEPKTDGIVKLAESVYNPKIDFFVKPKESDNEIIQNTLNIETEILKSYISRADKLTKEIYPSLTDSHLMGMIRSKFVDQLLILHQIRESKIT